MKIRAKWTGDLPNVGDHLMSSHRPRFAYRILKIDGAKSGSIGDAPAEDLKITVDRVKLRDVPDNATIHAWRWASRDSKRVFLGAKREHAKRKRSK